MYEHNYSFSLTGEYALCDKVKHIFIISGLPQTLIEEAYFDAYAKKCISKFRLKEAFLKCQVGD